MHTGVDGPAEERGDAVGTADLRNVVFDPESDLVERAIWPEELESFEQMFITGSAAEVTFVREAGPWNFEVGDLSRQLAQDYDDLVNGRLPNR